MKRLLAFVFMIAVVAGAQTAQKSSSAAHSDEEIVQLMQQWLAAGHTGNAAALDTIEADEFIATTPSGDVVTKSQLMPEPGSGTLPKLSVRDNTVRISGDTAVLMSRLVGEQGGPQLNATNVFVRRNGKWRMIAAQLSPHAQRD